MKELTRRGPMANYEYEELDLGFVGEGGGNVDTVDGIDPDEVKNVQLRFFVTDDWWKNADRPLPPGRYIIVDGGGDIGPLIDQKIADHNAATASHPDKAKRYSKVYNVTIAVGEYADKIGIIAINGSIGLSNGTAITTTGVYEYDDPVEITSITGTFSGNATITVDYDLSDLVEKVDSEITERKQNEGNLNNLQTQDKSSLTAAINESYQKALKKLSDVTQNLYSDIALKTYVEQGTGQVKAYQLLGTALDGAIHTLIELAQYGAIQQVEVGSETIHLNLNNIGGVDRDNHITVDTQDDEGAGVKLSLAYLTDVVAQCAEALQSAKDYADEKDAALRVDALIIQPPCKESELPPYDPDEPWEPSHNGYWYQIKDFDVSYPGKNYKGTATWHDDLGEGEPGYYLARDNYGHADGVTTKENEEGQIAVTGITKASIQADTNPFTALADVAFLTFIGSVIEKINGAFQLTASLNTMIGNKAANIQSLTAPTADAGTPAAAENETLPDILQDIWDFIAGRVPTDRSFGGLSLSADRSAADVKTALNITSFDDDSEVPDGNLNITLTDETASETLPEAKKTEIRALLQKIRNNLKAVFTNGFATDVRIGNRTLVNNDASGALVPVDAKSLTQWLQGIRDNLKGLFAAIAAETANREAYDEQQDQKIQTLNGHYYPIEPYDFGKTLDVKTPVPEDIAALNDYAMSIEGVDDPSQIIDGTVVKNLFDGVEFVWNATNQTWVDFGIGNIVTASNDHLGVVEGTADPGDGTKDGMVTVLPGGTMKTLGFAEMKTAVGGKQDALPAKAGATDILTAPASKGGTPGTLQVGTSAGTVAAGDDMRLNTRQLYKGADNTAGLLIDLGEETVIDQEIIFDIIYNETSAGNLVRQAAIHGQVYGGAGNRAGMVQNGNKPVEAFYFQGTAGGVGNTHSFLWIPSSNPAYFPSAMVEAWQGPSAAYMSKMAVSASTLTAAPAETLVPVELHPALSGSVTTFGKTYGNIPGPNVPPTGVSIKLGTTNDRFYLGSATLRQNNSIQTVKFDFTIHPYSAGGFVHFGITKILNDYRATSVYFYHGTDGAVYLYVDLVSNSNTHHSIEAACCMTENGQHGNGAVTYVLPEYRWETGEPAYIDKTETKTIAV
jgi:hypothetical protein